MRIGLHPGDFGVPGPVATHLARTVETAEEIGIHSLWFMDHLFQIPLVGEPTEPMLEAYSALAWTAARTERVHLGALVTAVPYRAPGLLLKTITTLDVLSGGRAWLGLGAAWNEYEAKSLGLPFPPLARRFEQLSEVLQLAEQMFGDDPSPFSGTHFQLDQPINHPQPVRRPPILIGGGGERKTLRLVARHADATNLFERNLERKLRVLAEHCEREGRPFADVVVTTTGRLEPSASIQQSVERFAHLADLGVDLAIVLAPEPFHRHADYVAELVEAVSDLGRQVPPQLVGAAGGVEARA